MFERFTSRARRVIVLAQEEARDLGHNYIGTEHLLLGLVREEEGVAALALRPLGVTLQATREQVQAAAGPAAPEQTGHIPFTPRAKKVLELSLREALQLRHNYIGTEHILLGLVLEGERLPPGEAKGKGVEALTALGAGLERVRERVMEVLREMHPEGVAAAESATAAAGPSSIPGVPPGLGRRLGEIGSSISGRLDQLLGRLERIEQRLASIEHRLMPGQEPAGPQQAQEPPAAPEPPAAQEPPAAPQPPGPDTGEPHTGTE
jgi:ATP-dependent Clp protease ATP-binding subunit ClpC